MRRYEEKGYREEIETLRQKERTYLAAILGSAEGYVEADLTKNAVTECSEFFRSMYRLLEEAMPPGREITYSEFNSWICSSMEVSDADRFCEICSREYLLKRFEEGERRASIQFYAQTKDGAEQPCRYLIFLYMDSVTGDVNAFCVLYDLTEQQRKDLELKKLEEELQMSRIRNFASQMQPHFLYNTLGSIQEIMHEDPEYASDLLGDFSVHLRSCIRAMSGDRPIPFEQELQNIRAYVNIEKMRFAEKLTVEYDIQTTDFSVLPLSVQPIVENAIRHGVYGRGPEGGTVRLRTRKDEDSFIVEVEDDGTGFDIDEVQRRAMSDECEHTGLKNLIFRLGAVMDGSVDIESEQGKGTKVTIRLPAERSD